MTVSERHVYKFDRLRNGRKMAQGATISRCSNPEDAQKAAARLFGNHPYESFVLQEIDGEPVNDARAERSRGAPEAAADFQEVCIECGHKFGVWFADNPVWNEIIPRRVGMLCPCCFIARADKRGFRTTGWKMVPMDNPLGEESVEVERTSRGAPEAAAERLARFMAQKESLNCKTLDDAVHHQSKWQRIVPEAKEMLEAAYPDGAGHVVLLEALRHTLPILISAIAFVDCKAVVAEVRAAIKQAERT